MPASTQPREAVARATLGDDAMVVDLEGVWRLEDKTPRWSSLLEGAGPKKVRFRAGALESWDTSLVMFMGDALDWCRRNGSESDLSGVPEKLRRLAQGFEAALRTSEHAEHAHSFTEEVGLSTRHAMKQAQEMLQFVGESSMDSLRLFFGRASFRWGDCLAEMQKCGAMALPIVSLIAFLVGVTLAYSGAIVLKRFGAEIWVADLIGVGMTREMGALMAAIVLSGRTGAAFAAEIGSMKANEEIDALSTLGISPVRFLVMPRVVALGLMMPLLALYANCMGILGGMTVAAFNLDVPPAAYWVEMLTIVDLPDVTVGVVKAVVFGLIVGFTGCLRGLQAERDASGVGRAATSAVVTAVLFITCADAVFAVLFHVIGL